MSSKDYIVELKNIKKNYKLNISVLDGITINFYPGKFYVINGKSGSGKSTLINILGLIDKQTEGTYKLFEKNVNNLKDEELSKIRMENIGFVFQDSQLNETLNALENVMLPMTINNNIKRAKRKEIAFKYLTLVGLKNRINHFPNEMSGGEKQRVGIARALANDPCIILADEPTGNLDEENEKEVFTILKRLSQNGKLVIVVSHSNISKQYADIVLTLNDGLLE